MTRREIIELFGAKKPDLALSIVKTYYLRAMYIFCFLDVHGMHTRGRNTLCYNQQMSESSETPDNDNTSIIARDGSLTTLMLPRLSDPSEPLPGPCAAPWERLGGENEQDYVRFVTYVKLGLSLKDVCAHFALSYPHVRRIAAKNRWRARREAYLVEERAETRAAMRNAAQRHADALVQGWNGCLEWAIESVAYHRARGTVLDPRTAAQVLKSSTDALRLLDGKPNAIVAHDLSKASVAELEEILKKLEGK